LPPPRGGLARRGHRAPVAATDVVGEISCRFRQVLAYVLVRRVDRACDPDHDAGHDPTPTRHRYSSFSGRFSPLRKVLRPREIPAVAEETLITPPLTPRVITAVVWSSSPVMPATSPTASSSCVSWLFMLSTVMWVFPRSGTTCPVTSLIVCSVVEKTLASRKNSHARTKNATAIPAKRKPFISSTKTSNPTAPPSRVPGNPHYSCDRTQKVPLSRAPARDDAAPDDPLSV